MNATNGRSVNATAAPSWGTAYLSAVAAGSTLFAGVRIGDATTVPTVSDQLNGAWELVAGPVNLGTSGVTNRGFVFAKRNTAAGTPVVTVDLGGVSESGSIAIGELQNVRGNETLEAFASNSEASGTAKTSGTVAGSRSGGVISFLITGGSITVTPTGGETNVTNTTGVRSHILFESHAAAGNFTHTATTSGATTSAFIAVAVRDPATVYVNTASTAGGNGSTNNTTGANRAFASLSEWEAARQSTLVEVEEVICSSPTGVADTTTALILGWTTTASFYIDIKTASGSRHAGSWDTSKYRLSVANAFALDIRANHVRVDGLLAEVSSATATQVTVNAQSLDAGADIWISNTIARTHADAGFIGNVFTLSDADAVFRLKNVVAHVRTTNSSSRGLSVTAATTYLYNLTVYNLSGTGIRNFAGTMNCKNVAVVASTGFTLSGGTINREYVVTSDATADDSGGAGNQINITEASMAFTNATNTDFRIGSGSSLVDVGADLTLDASWAFATDLLGNYRRYAWDIGAHEYGATSEAVITRYVNTASSSGGNGTSNATSGANRAYVSLTAWEAARQGDLGARGYREEVLCEGTDTTQLSLDGWTTSASFYIDIRARIRHNGVTGGFTHTITATSSSYVVNEEYLKIDGIHFNRDNTNTSGCRAIDVQATVGVGQLDVSNCLMHATGAIATTDSALVLTRTNLQALRVWNCIAYDLPGDSDEGAAVRTTVGNSTNSIRISNCTFVNCQYGVYVSSGSTNVIVKNCLVQNPAREAFRGAFDAASNYNASSTADTTGGANDRANQTFTFIDAAGKNFHLAPGDVGAKGHGVDLSSDPSLAFTTDIDGHTRRGTWDIGADQVGVLKLQNVTGDNTSGTLTISAPSAGNLLVMTMFERAGGSDTAHVSPGAGWTKRAGITQSPSHSTYRRSASVWTKTAVGTEGILAIGDGTANTKRVTCEEFYGVTEAQFADAITGSNGEVTDGATVSVGPTASVTGDLFIWTGLWHKQGTFAQAPTAVDWTGDVEGGRDYAVNGGANGRSVVTDWNEVAQRAAGTISSTGTIVITTSNNNNGLLATLLVFELDDDGGGTVHGDANATGQGATATTNSGAGLGSGDANITGTGQVATAGLGSVTTTGDATVSVTGQSTSAVAGTASASGEEGTANGTAEPAGVSTAAAVGSSVATGSANSDVNGQQTTAALGVVVSSGAANVAITGQQTIGAVGDVTAEGEQNAEIEATGVAATSALGSSTTTGDSNVVATGSVASAVVGTASASGEDVVHGTATPVGVGVTSTLGSVVVTGAGTVTTTGVLAQAQVGEAAATGVRHATVEAVGVTASALAGTASASGSTIVHGTAEPAGISIVPTLGVVSARADAIRSAIGSALLAQIGQVQIQGDARINALGSTAVSAVGPPQVGVLIDVGVTTVTFEGVIEHDVVPPVIDHTVTYRS